MLSLAYGGPTSGASRSSRRAFLRAGEPASRPVRASEQTGTIVHTLLDAGKLRIKRGAPQQMSSLLDRARPIAE